MRAFKHERAARGGAPAAPVNRGARRRGSWHVFCSSALGMSLRSRVLVVDDEMGVRESLRAILHGECEVVTAASGEAALDAMARDPIDVMTLDLKMPGLGGIGVLERAKQIDPDLEVLIITGYGSLDTAVQGLRLRAFDYLSKPFDSAQVRRLVARAIARRAAVRRMKTLPEQLLTTDEDKLVRLVRALADNAVRYTTEGEVVLVARPAATGVTLEVRDSGPGIDPELIVETEDVIAGRATTRPPRLLGFGLRLAGRLVRILGASLTMAAGPDGTTCHLVVPDLAAAESSRSAQAATA